MIVDGTRVPLTVTATRDELLACTPVRATPCSTSTRSFEPGAHRVRLAATRWAQPVTVTLNDGELAAPQRAGGDATVQYWRATSRRVDVHAPAAALLVVHENFNAGWVAELDGRRLEAVRVDGWQQAFLIPAGTAGAVEIMYAPQRAMLAGLVIGAAGAPALLGLALVRPRRAPPPPTEEKAVSSAVVVGFALLLCLLLCGIVGTLVVAAVVAIVGPLLGRAGPPAAAIVGPAALIVAGSTVATAGSPTSMIAEANSPSVQVLCVFAVVMTLVAGLTRVGRDDQLVPRTSSERPPREGPTSARRRRGADALRSTGRP
jgi:arabinofuranan 3-O-arabinosyltransferase